jgi:tetratricopeptide (TPR) repeat protein
LLEGISILEEIRGDLPLVLWMTLRDVMLWSSTRPDRRAGLFSPGAEALRHEVVAVERLEPALDVSLRTLATVVSHAAQANPYVIGLVCMDVAEWARAQGAMGTAVWFAQAAAFAQPETPVPALAVGTLTVEWGRYRRAETWLRRAIGLARRAGDWESYSKAYAELGEVYVRTGRAAQAPRYYQQAAGLARRHGLREVRARALHGLLRTSLATGELDAADEYASGAQRAYGRAHPRLPDLHLDMAHLRVLRGQHARAVPLLRRHLASFPDDPARRALCHALLTHAAAALGDAPTYERQWAEAWALLDSPDSASRAADVLRHLNTAATLAEDWLRVQLAGGLEGIANAEGL